MRWIINAFPEHPLPETVMAGNILRDLVDQGVTHFFNLVYPLEAEETDNLNEFNAAFCQRIPGAIPFASLHQDTPEKVRVAEAALKSYDYVGFKFHPFFQGFHLWDRRMKSLFAFLQEAGKPVLLHTGFEDFYQSKMPVSELQDLLRQFPRLPVVFVHMAFPELSSVFRLLDTYPDLYLDATNVLAVRRPEFQYLLENLPEGEQILDILIAGLEKYSERIMYGSDHPAGFGSLGRIYQDLEQLPISDQAKRDIRTGTAKSFVSRFKPDFDWSQKLSLDSGRTYRKS